MSDMMTKTQELREIDEQIVALKRKRLELAKITLVRDIDLERSNLDHRLDMLAFRREITVHRYTR